MRWLLILPLLLFGCIQSQLQSQLKDVPFISQTISVPANSSFPLANDSRNPDLAPCHWHVAANGAYLPDPFCSPGVTLPVTADDICVKGYSASVRNVPESEKDSVYAEYGILAHLKGDWEIDHIVSLELGGSNDIRNLYPEPAEPTPGFHEKDKVENYLHDQVCNHGLPLEKAQRIVATDWTQAMSFTS